MASRKTSTSRLRSSSGLSRKKRGRRAACLEASTDSLQTNFFLPLRDVHFPTQFLHDGSLQERSSHRLTVNEVGFLRTTLERLQPFKQFGRISVIAELLESRDLCSDRNELAVDLYFFRAILDGSATRSRRLEPDEQNQVPRVG